jgi:hypothetical protein
MEEDTLPESGDRLRPMVAVLIALVALWGAVVAWRAAVAADEAGDADSAGLHATLNAEQTRTLNNTTVYEHYRAYTTYLRHTELGNLLATDMEQASEEESFVLDQQRAEAFDSASAIEDFFLSQYLNRDGSYNTQRELGEAWAEAGKKKDLNPEPHFQEADRLRAKANYLVGVLIGLGLALVCYTMAEGLQPTLRMFRYGLVLAGSLAMLISVAATVAIELRF